MLKNLSDSAFKSDKFLPVEIAHYDYLDGDISLAQEYQKKIENYLKEIISGIPRNISRALILLLEGTQELTPDDKIYSKLNRQ